MTKNEATFEAHLGAVLATLFPAGTVQVTHQIQFTIRLGHQDIAIDGRKGWEKKGRLDILLTADAGNVAVLELKRPGLDLADEDRDQGLSYARLLNPMPPLVIVSNGSTTNFYTTNDGQPWAASSVSEEVFEKLVSGAAASAAHDRDQAIRSVLGANPDIWADFLRAHTSNVLVKRTGELHDFGLPFATDFMVERSIVPLVLGKLRKKVSALVVVGPPLSGKSVVLKQCCEKMTVGNLVPLYIDASSAKQGPLRLLSSLFVKHLFSATSLDQVRQWLSTSLRAMQGDTRLVLMLDEVVPDLSETWLEDLDELLSLSEGSPISIVLALDPNTWQALSMRPGRTVKTELGRRAEVIQLGLLTDREFSTAMDLFYDVARSQPYFGAHHTVEYREPRVLRVIAAAVRRHKRTDQNVLLKFPSTTTINEVELAWRAFVRPNHELVDKLRALARAYFEDLAKREDYPELQLASHRAAAIGKDAAVKSLGESTVEWLIAHGYLSTRLGPREEVLLLPRHLELFARAAALELGDAVSAATTFKESYETLMQRSDLLPLGDVVGADALRVVAERKPELFSRIINQALSDAPRNEVLPAGSVVEISLFGRPLGSFETPEPSILTGNLHPWLVLAQVAMLPLGGPEGEVSPNGWIVAAVGAHDGLLRRIGDERWRKMESFHYHDIPGKGSVPCLNNGVVEPIGEAMITGFHDRSEEMVSMTEFAIEEDQFHLAWRLHTAAREAASATDPKVSEAAEEVVALTHEYFSEHYEQLLHETPGSEDGAENVQPTTSHGAAGEEEGREEAK